MALTTAGRQVVASLIAGATFGVGVGFALWFPREKPVVETAQPAVRQADSSLVLQRAPDARLAPAAIIPKGETLDREAQVTVQPPALVVHDSVFVPATTGPTPAHEIAHVDTIRPPPLRLRIDYTDLADGTHRVIASSPDGAVLGGLDIPVKAAVAVRVTKWGAGLVRNLLDASYAAFVQRDLGPILVYGDAQPKQGLAPAGIRVGVGLRF